MRNPKDTKYVWDEKNLILLKKNIMKTHFDKQVDKIKAMLSDKIADLKLNPDLFEDDKQNYINHLQYQMNKIEFAREVHSHYVLTGEVKIPE